MYKLLYLGMFGMILASSATTSASAQNYSHSYYDHQAPDDGTRGYRERRITAQTADDVHRSESHRGVALVGKGYRDRHWSNGYQDCIRDGFPQCSGGN